MYNENQLIEVNYESIGIVPSPFEDIHGMPIQPAGAKGVKGRVEIKREYVDGLKDIDGFSNIIFICLKDTHCL